MIDAADIFAAFRSEVMIQTPLRSAITAAYRVPEPECVPPLLVLATASAEEAKRIGKLARALVAKLRAKTRSSGVEGLIHEYSLSSQEGVALMCLAEALLRIPDAATRDALIRDKLAPGDWRAHVGMSPSLFVNAATWGLVLTGRLVTTTSEQGLSAALTRLIARSGEPIIRAGVDVAMRLMGEQFVTGRTIEEAIGNSREREARGFTFSYDMLGEAATTAQDAARNLDEYERAVHAIGRASHRRGIYEGPGISIKLSALHPRYQRIKRARVMNELLPRVKHLAALAKAHDIGFNIDAEEADRLDLSLDILEALSLDPDLKGWNGLGFVIQAYGKRCSAVIDWLIDLGRRSRRRLMIRLVKGAYWDSEIKRAQVEGLDGFPVFTRKVYTDVSYLACARKLLAAPDAVYPQFATHNAQTLVSVLVFAGPDFYRGQYEFQCLHGMGEPLYEEVVGRHKLDRPCRVYAPVGSHETLLAYLVRRLLENGANTSFVNRIADASVALDDLIADPVAVSGSIQPLGAPHDRIAAPRDLYAPDRVNSRGLDFSNEGRLDELAKGLQASADTAWRAFPPGATEDDPGEAVLNPANLSDVVGFARHARPDEIAEAIAVGDRAAPAFAAIPPNERAAVLRRAADLLEARNDLLVGLIVREAGKSYANAVAEVREAADFLRYYGHEAARTLLPGSPAPAWPRRLHQPVELSARDLHRASCRLAGGGQFRHRQTSRRDAAHRRGSFARAARGRRSTGCAAAHAGRGRSRRGAGRRSARSGRRLHRLDAGRAPDRKGARGPPHPPRRAACPSLPRPAALTRWWSIPRRSPNRSSSTSCRRLSIRPDSAVRLCASSASRRKSPTACSRCSRAPWPS